jgi:hypothetical protein
MPCKSDYSLTAPEIALSLRSRWLFGYCNRKFSFLRFSTARQCLETNNLFFSDRTSLSDCQRLCNAGTYSYNGQDNLDPATGLSTGACIPCNLGTYSPDIGSKQCVPCTQVWQDLDGFATGCLECFTYAW